MGVGNDGWCSRGKSIAEAWWMFVARAEGVCTVRA